MNLLQIKELAERESLDFSSYLCTINKARENHPHGVDIYIPIRITTLLVSLCDFHKIPIYHVEGDICSTAATYLDLFTYESAR